MASLTVRNIPEDAKLRFRQIAAAHGRSMEEHLRQLVMGAELAYNATEQSSFKELRDVAHNFQHQKSKYSIDHSIDVEDGANDGIVDKYTHTEIRFMTAKDAMAELRRLAGGVGFDAPPRMNTELEAPSF